MLTSRKIDDWLRILLHLFQFLGDAMPMPCLADHPLGSFIYSILSPSVEYYISSLCK